MPGNGELIRSLRAGGSGAQAAAREIARLGNEGQINFTPAEAVEVRGIIELPEFKDHYTPEVKASLDRIGSSAPAGTQQPASPVSSLVPSLQQLTDARQLPQQFEKDLAVMKQQLVEHPGLTNKEQNARLFEFFTNYAERLASMVNRAGDAPKDQNKGQQQGGFGQGTGKGGAPETYKLHVPPDMVGPQASKLASADLLYSMKANAGPQVALSAAQRQGVLKEFEAVLNKAGFGEMRDANTGRSGLDVAKELLSLSTARAVRDAAMRANMDVHVRMQAHPTSTIKIDPSLAAEAMRADGTMNAGKAKALPGLKVNPEDEGRDTRGRDRRGSNGKILGSHLLWNVLHRYREFPDDEEQAAEQAKMLELMIAGGLAFMAIALVIGLWMVL